LSFKFYLYCPVFIGFLSAFPMYFLPKLSFQSSCLPVHVLHYDIIDLPQGSAVFKDFPWFICMEMNLYQLFIPNSQQASPLK
jgi:hypothetical protein